MKARVVIEVEASDYDAAMTSPLLNVSLDEVTVRQTDGLFEGTRSVLWIDPLATEAREQAGVDVTRPAVRIYVQRPEEEH